MTCNNKCIHYPVCEQKNYDFANIEECPYYYDASTVSLQDIYQEGHYDGHLEGYTKAINEERPQGELKEYKPFEVDYNVKSAVENLKTAYWSNDTEKYAKAFTEADQMIVSAICHYGYIVVKGGAENG